MGILGNSAAITRYTASGDELSLERIRLLLEAHRIEDINGSPADMAVGFAPFDPDESASFDDRLAIGEGLFFRLRIDKKNIPNKVVTLLVNREVNKRLKASGRETVSKGEKRTIREAVLTNLLLKVPSTPNEHDVMWANGEVWLFTTQKSAREELETLFTKTFKVNLTQRFPFTSAGKMLSNQEMAKLIQLPPMRLV